MASAYITEIELSTEGVKLQSVNVGNRVKNDQLLSELRRIGDSVESMGDSVKSIGDSVESIGDSVESISNSLNKN